MTEAALTPCRRQRVARAVAAVNGCPVGCPACAPTVDALMLDALPAPAERLPRPRAAR